MVQKDFAKKATEVLKIDEGVLGLAVGGSWITGELDEFSDLDLILVTRERISDDFSRMNEYAQRLGTLISGFTGEHVGEPRLLICLYDDPLLHVDIKFVTLEEFEDRVEEPEILWDREGQLRQVLERTRAHFPLPDYQWIEDRFWIWVHYVLLKIGRGELLEALDGMSFLRITVLGPLTHMRNDRLPRGVRKAEFDFRLESLRKLLATIPKYDRSDLIRSLHEAIALYRELRMELYGDHIERQGVAEDKVMMYFATIAEKDR